MRSEVPVGARTYLFAISRWINAVDNWTLGSVTGVANSLENRRLSGIGSSDNEYSELGFAGALGNILLCSHGTKVCKMAKGLNTRKIAEIATSSRTYICALLCGHYFRTLRSNTVQISVDHERPDVRACSRIHGP
jgi:hypothetical protein